MTQYDVEVYQRIEHMLGKKLEEFPAPQEEARPAPRSPCAHAPLHAHAPLRMEPGHTLCTARVPPMPLVRCCCSWSE